MTGVHVDDLEQPRNRRRCGISMTLTTAENADGGDAERRRRWPTPPAG